jgi:hypothetical protein
MIGQQRGLQVGEHLQLLERGRDAAVRELDSAEESQLERVEAQTDGQVLILP